MGTKLYLALDYVRLVPNNVRKTKEKNEDQKAVYKMLEDQIQKHPSKVFEAMINNLTQE